MDISQVREVLELDKVTKVPQTPEMMRGVINLRGSVVPVIDIRLKFGMGKRNEEFIIILEIEKIFTLDELAMVQQVQEASSEAVASRK